MEKFVKNVALNTNGMKKVKFVYFKTVSIKIPLEQNVLNVKHKTVLTMFLQLNRLDVKHFYKTILIFKKSKKDCCPVKVITYGLTGIVSFADSVKMVLDLTD